MLTEDSYITAQVFIRADDFVREILGEDPTPQKIEEFIKDHASLMEILYGSARVSGPKELNRATEFMLIDMIARKVCTIQQDTEFMMQKMTSDSLDKVLTKRPWWKRIFGL